MEGASPSLPKRNTLRLQPLFLAIHWIRFIVVPNEKSADNAESSSGKTKSFDLFTRGFDSHFRCSMEEFMNWLKLIITFLNSVLSGIFLYTMCFEEKWTTKERMVSLFMAELLLVNSIIISSM